jgi:hypothetical protein
MMKKIDGKDEKAEAGQMSTTAGTAVVGDGSAPLLISRNK